MKLIPYLNFDGNCEAAFQFYEQVFGGKLVDKMLYGGSPMEADVPSEWHNKIMHAYMQIGDQELMGSDCPPDYFKEPQGTEISIHMEDLEKAEQIFKALAENGTVKMDMQETFWAKRFGMVTDQFGIPWMINCDKTD
ncbi:MAG: VOC family protein [Leptolyngbyaceae bacterium]|nr:VOC family protein [Leptolyngbyaceae bacterium]